MAKSSEARIKANYKYAKSHYKRIALDIPVDLVPAWQESASTAGQKMRAYIIDAVEARRARESAATVPAQPETGTTTSTSTSTTTP